MYVCITNKAIILLIKLTGYFVNNVFQPFVKMLW